MENKTNSFLPEESHESNRGNLNDIEFKCLVCGDKHSDLLFSQKAWANEKRYVTVCKLCYEDVSHIENSKTFDTGAVYEYKSIKRRFSYSNGKTSFSVLKKGNRTFMLTYDRSGNFSDSFEFLPGVFLNYGTFMEN